MGKLQFSGVAISGLPSVCTNRYLFYIEISTYHFSGVSLLSLDGNLFDTKSLDSLPGYDKYMDRYTAVKRKLD